MPAGGAWPPTGTTPVNVSEVNPVTIDSALADDGDTTDDAVEQIGRCVPILSAANAASIVDDYSMSGVYSFALPVPTGTTNSFQQIMPSQWHYHFALELFNQFTAVSNPESDYFPNMDPGSWLGAIVPVAASNTAAKLANNLEDAVGVEGLVNVNTASWRVLASLELIPRSQDRNGVLNERAAQAIVHYRDVDDGVIRYASVTVPLSVGGPWVANGPIAPPRGHGPFNSIMELSQVFDDYVGRAAPSGVVSPTASRALFASIFQNAFSPSTSPNPFPTDFSAEATRHQWGYYTPGPELTAPTNDLQSDDWVSSYLMVNRLSNLLTTRSDTFTVYVIVQGWKNVNTINGAAAAGSLPELVVESRLAATVDRSGIVHNSGSPKVTNFTTK
jgi:hypothetical protein